MLRPIDAARRTAYDVAAEFGKGGTLYGRMETSR